MLLWTIRAFYLLILAGAAAKISRDFTGMMGLDSAGWGPVAMFVGIVGVGLLAIVIDLCYPRKRISSITAVYFGLLIGILLGHLLGLAFGPTLELFDPSSATLPAGIAGKTLSLPKAFSLVTTSILCYICVSVLLQTKDDFRFIIPYVEFSRQLKGGRPLILDTSVIIDGRIADIADTGLIDQPLIVARFVLQEIQGIADSSDKLRRNRGRRGLDMLDRLKQCPRVTVEIHEGEPEGQPKREVDAKLIALAKAMSGRLVTNDSNLAKSAKLQGVDTVSIHEVGNAAKPPVLHGEMLAVRLVKEGEGPGQGIGYLDDGTMVVAEMGKNFVGTEVNLVVTSVLQTNAGRMVFGRIDARSPEPARPAAPRR